MGLIDESWSMVELEGARMQFEHALFQLFCEGPTSSSTSTSLMLQDGYYSSQYKREFDEFERIGGGAFGKVRQLFLSFVLYLLSWFLENKITLEIL